MLRAAKERVPSRFVGVLVVVTLVGLALSAWAASRVSPFALVIWPAVTLGIELLPARVREDIEVSLLNVVVFTALLVSGPEAAIVASWGGAIRVGLRWRHAPERLAYNFGQFAISAAVAAAFYETFHPASAASPAGLVILFVAAGVFTVVNAGLVGAAISLNSGERFRDIVGRLLRSFLLLEVPYVALSVVAATLIDRGLAIALLLMGVPALVARHALLAFQREDEAYDGLVTSFVKAIEVKDLYTRGHSERVSQLSEMTAAELGLSYEERRLIRYAALLHDVGKIGVPLCIINKPGALSDDEFEEMKKHPQTGARILRDIDFLHQALDIVHDHHERLDGRGYPRGKTVDQLGFPVRIVTAVDAFDAMTSTRSYRRALEVDEAVSELRRHAGRQFDARAVEALARVVERVGWQSTVEFASEAALGRLQPASVRQVEGETAVVAAEADR